MAKKVTGSLKLEVPAGAANPSPPIGPALGQAGLNIMEFVKRFNADTAKLEPGMPIPVVITVFSDRTFVYVTKTPPASYFFEEGGEARIRIVEAGAGHQRFGHDGRCPQDRRSENERPERERYRRCDEDHRWLGAFDGS